MHALPAQHTRRSGTKCGLATHRAVTEFCKAETIAALWLHFAAASSPRSEEACFNEENPYSKAPIPGGLLCSGKHCDGLPRGYGARDYRIAPATTRKPPP